jgi:tetratricopeptide (TPR) repeat protein
VAAAHDRTVRDVPAQIVGRTRELSLIARQLEDSAPPLLLLAGEPGIGKSCLLQEAVRLAAAEGWQVLQGGCQRRGGEDAFAPIVAALAQHIRRQPAGRLRLALQRCGWLIRLLPELVGGPMEPLPPWTPAPDQERRLVFEAVRRYLEQVAGPAGTLLVLDDLQWASADGLDLLAAIIRNTGSAPVQVIGAYRDSELSAHAPLSALLADLAQAGIVRRQHLAPLTSAEAAQLFDRLAPNVPSPQAVRERVLRLTGGVPFFVASYAQELEAGDGASGDQEVPWSIGHSVRQRLAALSAAGQAVVCTAAVLGRVVQPSLLAAVAARPEQEVANALAEACAARLLVEHEEVYGFAHDVIREVVESDLGTAQRQLLHRHAVAALERLAGAATVEALALHAARSGDSRLAARYLEQAGDHARTQAAHLAAEQHYLKAVMLLDQQGEVLAATRVREKLGAVLRVATRYTEALAVLERAAGAYRAQGDLEELGRIIAEIGWVHADGRTPAEGLARLEPTLALLVPRASARVLAGLSAAHAYLLHLQGRYHEQLAAAEQAERYARAVGDMRHLAEALVTRGGALNELGRMAEALDVLAQAVPVAEGAGTPYILCFALVLTGAIQEECGAFEASRQVNQRALQIAEQGGDHAMVACATTRRGMSAFYMGTWGAARQDYARAVAIIREVGPSWSSVYPFLDLARLCLAEGAWVEAEQHLEECGQYLRSIPDRDVHAEVAVVLAERDILAGRPDVAHTRLVSLLDEEALQGIGVIPHLLVRQAWALLALGEVDRAAAVASRVIARTRDEGRMLPLVDALRMAALAAVRQERWEDAERALEDGISLARCLHYPYAEARFLQAYGELLVQLRQPGPPRERLEAALAIFQRLGARKDIERTEQLLTRLG